MANKWKLTQSTEYNGWWMHYSPLFDSYMIGRDTSSVCIPGMMSEVGAKNHIDTVLNK